MQFLFVFFYFFGKIILIKNGGIMKIKDIVAYEVIDSRGNPTVECEVTLANNITARAIVPSGASTGEREALELRDGEPRFSGKGVKKAIKNVNKIIAPALIGMDVSKQRDIDNKMISLDGSEFKTKLGANATLSVSLAAARANALNKKQPLYSSLGNGKIIPMPMMNIVNGGAHADSNVDFQEFMIVPVGAKTIVKRLEYAHAVFNELKKILKQKHYSTGVGDEGGFAPNFKSNTEPLDCIVEAIKNAGLTPKTDVAIALDIAASEFYNSKTKKYDLKKSKSGSKTTDEMIAWYTELIKKYPIISIEDPLDQNDWEGFKKLTKKLGKRIQIVGDDLFVTNPKILQKGIDLGVCNAILIKPNQIGTLSETLNTIALAKSHGYNTIISHRSGESEDTFIADLAVATNAGQIKTGSICRTDRVSKYNQLIRIDREINNRR